MIPIRDTIQSRHYPLINITLIFANIAFFFVQISRGQFLPEFVLSYGLVPAHYSSLQALSQFGLSQQIIPFFSYMFLHGSFWHLLGNMWFLYIFGDNVEDRLGHVRYLIFYLLCGLVSGFVHIWINLGADVPVIGASGATAGVMGAYFVLHPRSRILTLIPIIIIPFFVEIPALIFLGIWFLLQFFNATQTYAAMAGIAWWAHIGGFLFGMIYILLLLRRR
jgi:hypothetical protein